jgi:hypothetical protein
MGPFPLTDGKRSRPLILLQQPGSEEQVRAFLESCTPGAGEAGGAASWSARTRYPDGRNHLAIKDRRRLRDMLEFFEPAVFLDLKVGATAITLADLKGRQGDDTPGSESALPSPALHRRRLPNHVKQGIRPFDEEVCAVREFVVNRAGAPPGHLVAGGELGPAHLRPGVAQRDLRISERALQIARALDGPTRWLEVGRDAPRPRSLALREAEILEELKATSDLMTRASDRRLPRECDTPIGAGLALDLTVERADVTSANARLARAHLVARRARA